MHRHVERVIGRLVTDEAFRAAFEADPRGTLADVSRSGLELSIEEVEALLATDRAAWGRTARTLDERLQKVDLHRRDG